MSWKSFWQIVFDIDRENRCPRLRLEMSLWDIDSPARLLGREDYWYFDPTCRYGTVDCSDGHWAKFDQAWLEYTVNLGEIEQKLLDEAANLLTAEEFAGLNEWQQTIGQSIYIEADAFLDHFTSGFSDFPIFWFPQSSLNGEPLQGDLPDDWPLAAQNQSIDSVQLVETHEKDGCRRTYWGISGENYLSPCCIRFGSQPLSYRIIVRQAGPAVRPDDYEFGADAIPRGTTKASIVEHYFPAGETVFRIGWAPEYPDGLTGWIRRLVFDPNNSCVSCAL